MNSMVMGDEIHWESIQSAAEWLGVTEQTIRNWVYDGLFPAYQLNPRGKGRRILIKREDILIAMEKGRIVPKQWGKGVEE